MNKLNQLLWICGAPLATCAFVWLAVRAIRWAKKGTRAGSMLAAAAFPFPMILLTSKSRTPTGSRKMRNPEILSKSASR